MNTLASVLEENETLEALLEAANARIAELEKELRLWQSGAKSLAVSKVEEHLDRV